MGKTYRREKNWDDEPVQFERRSNKNHKNNFKMKEDSYQNQRREKDKKRMEEYFNNESQINFD